MSNQIIGKYFNGVDTASIWEYQEYVEPPVCFPAGSYSLEQLQCLERWYGVYIDSQSQYYIDFQPTNQYDIDRIFGMLYIYMNFLPKYHDRERARIGFIACKDKMIEQRNQIENFNFVPDSTYTEHPHDFVTAMNKNRVEAFDKEMKKLMQFFQIPN